MNCNYRNFINTKIYFDSRTNVSKTNRFFESKTQKRTMNKKTGKSKKRHYLCRIVWIVFASFIFLFEIECERTWIMIRFAREPFLFSYEIKVV